MFWICRYFQKYPHTFDDFFRRIPTLSLCFGRWIGTVDEESKCLIKKRWKYLLSNLVLHLLAIVQNQSRIFSSAKYSSIECKSETIFDKQWTDGLLTQWGRRRMCNAVCHERPWKRVVYLHRSFVPLFTQWHTYRRPRRNYYQNNNSML